MSAHTAFPSLDQHANVTTRFPRVVRLWILRILFSLGHYKAFMGKEEFSNDDIARVFGFSAIIEGEEKYDRERILNLLRDLWRAEEAEFASTPPPCFPLAATVRRLADYLAMSDIERDVLLFRLAMNKYRPLRYATEFMGRATPDKIAHLLSEALGYPEDAVIAALSPTGFLAESGIISLYASGDLPESLHVMDSLITEIHFDYPDPLSYFRESLQRASAPSLSVDDFPHLRRDIEIVLQYVSSARAERRRGVNVLVYGEPGTGKTELVRSLAAKLGLVLFEVGTPETTVWSLDKSARFGAYRLSQSLLRGSSDAVVLFDEVEDVFRESDRGVATGANGSMKKAWVNKMLETNPVPAFWVTNHIDVIDPAFLRRFDYVIKIHMPPRSVRVRVLDRYMDGMPVSSGWKIGMAEHERLAPAVVERAAKVGLAMGCVAPDGGLERVIDRAIGNTLEAIGLPRQAGSGSNLAGFRLEALNTDHNLESVRSGVIREQRGRICLFGPPGTGKTAFGHHVAELLDRPLHARRASEILSKWVGETERNLARIFREALDEGAVLLIDEADSFLRDRQGAQRSWEVTQVNELLTQMERFDGILVVSTNLIDDVDRAALRRFDLKIRFDYLRSDQAWALFVDTRVRLGIQDGAVSQSDLASVSCLAPGDFANVIRQAQFRPIRTSRDLLQCLRQECEMKPGVGRRTIGFAA